jgi:hypothetical protein
MKKVGFIFSLLVLSGCAVTNPEISKNLTSGVIGCPPNEITITNETASKESNHNWTAECEGKVFICSYHPTSGVDCAKPLAE